MASSTAWQQTLSAPSPVPVTPISSNNTRCWLGWLPRAPCLQRQPSGCKHDSIKSMPRCDVRNESYEPVPTMRHANRTTSCATIRNLASPAISRTDSPAATGSASWRRARQYRRPVSPFAAHVPGRPPVRRAIDRARPDRQGEPAVSDRGCVGVLLSLGSPSGDPRLGSWCSVSEVADQLGEFARHPGEFGGGLLGFGDAGDVLRDLAGA